MVGAAEVVDTVGVDGIVSVGMGMGLGSRTAAREGPSVRSRDVGCRHPATDTPGVVDHRAAALFFLPLGLIAVVFSWRTGVWKRRDDLARARRNSRLALVFIIVTIIVGVLVYGGLLGALLALGAFSSPQ